ncbi:MAG: fluoride efflux transporter CrcB [Chloroflexi bacterium]|nr:fluoride efflux transporter CrcB [Chloroflexota bacterium]
MRYTSVATAAMLGANLRFAIATWTSSRWGAEFSYGTLLINITGAFVIGMFLALIGKRVNVNPLWRLFFATGSLGGYTTFSSYTWEALSLAQSGAWIRAGFYVVGSNVAGLVGVSVGATLVRLLPE